MLRIKEPDVLQDFNNYYVFSFNRELTYLQYNDTRWDLEKYGSNVRLDFNLENYEEGKIYIYRLKKKIFFQFIIEDYEYGRYNLDRRTLFMDNILGDDDFDPSWYDQ